MGKASWARLGAAAAIALGATFVAQTSSAAGLALQGSFHGTTGPTGTRGSLGAQLGTSVAVDGDTAVAGAPGENSGQGAAHVYTRANGVWTPTQTLTAPSGGVDAGANPQFGASVAMSGGTLMIGTIGANVVYVFTRSGGTQGTWLPQSPITEPGSGDFCFGCAIALSGSVAVIGAPEAMGNHRGAAYVFQNQAGSWQLQQPSPMIQGNAGEYLGYSVALSPDATAALVSDHGGNNGNGQVFVLNMSSGSWSAAPAPLVAYDGASGDSFGFSVALGNGTALVGAYGANSGQGAGYVFTQSGSGWTAQQPKLTAPSPATDDFFGISLALSGNLAVVGAENKAGSFGPGAAYVFTNDGSSWTHLSPQPLFATATGQYFGSSVGISGSTAVIGAFVAPDPSSGGGNAGAVYMFAPSAAPVPTLTRLGLIALALLLGTAGISASRKRSSAQVQP